MADEKHPIIILRLKHRTCYLSVMSRRVCKLTKGSLSPLQVNPVKRVRK